MDDGRISISWDELKTRRVETRLREQQAVARNRAYSQLQEDALPEATPTHTKFWHNTVVVNTAFGLMGGLVAWGALWLCMLILPWASVRVLHYDPNAKADAKTAVAEIHTIEAARDLGSYSKRQAEIATEQIYAGSRDNAYFQLATNTKLSDAQREARLNELKEDDARNSFIIEVALLGVCGLMIGLFLAIAEPVSQRKTREAVINGIAGSILGMTGGVVAAMVSTHVAGWASNVMASQTERLREIGIQMAIYGTLGLFLGIASGLVVWNPKKLLIGLVGGMLGGLVGGALFNPVFHWTGHQHDARLVALLAIGGVAALGTGFLENAAKAGWLKVTTGIIAGKQFILYRNPTYIGSAPDCQIYLFKDPNVGKRHAAIHLTPVGIEIEDLPLGTETRVNGKVVKRMALKNGDRIAVGATQFVFQERRPRAAK